jgi:hypothetical protein
LAVAGEEEGGEAELVCAEDAGVGVVEALDDLRAGMAEGVIAADRDDGVLRGNEGEEVWRGGGAAAVMADLEQRVGTELGGGLRTTRSRSLRCATG